MFSSFFPFRKINSQHKEEGGISIIEHNYDFRGKNNKRYIVICEQYEYNIYAVKFYCAEHKYCVHKFSRLTKQNECSRIITTVGKIMVEIYHNNPFASFAFVGSPLIEEKKNSTKRFKLYAKIIENLISPIHFEHHSLPSASVYVMINRTNPEIDLLNKIEEMFKNIFNF